MVFETLDLFDSLPRSGQIGACWYPSGIPSHCDVNKMKDGSTKKHSNYRGR